jgi:hypothetical protein
MALFRFGSILFLSMSMFACYVVEPEPKST